MIEVRRQRTDVRERMTADRGLMTETENGELGLRN